MPSRASSCMRFRGRGSMPAHRLLDRLAVDVDARGVGLDGGEDVPAQPRHVAEEPLVGGLAQGDVEADLVLGDLQALAVVGDVGRDRARRCRPGRAAGRCRRRRGPRRRGSPGRCPAGRRSSALPSDATIEVIGPIWARISSGTSSVIAETMRAATGSQSLRQTSSVVLSHSPRLQAAVDRTPEGSADSGSSHRSARRSASMTAARSAGVTDGSPTGFAASGSSCSLVA